MRVGHVDVDAQHLAEQFRGILRAMVRVVARSAVAKADVEKAVRAEHEVPAVVVRERLADEREARAPAQVEARRRIGRERVVRRSQKPRDDGVARSIGEVDEEPPRGGLRRKDETEQSTFAARDDVVAQIEEVPVEHDAVADGPDAAGLLDDELDRAIGGILDEGERVGEAGRMEAHAQRGLRDDPERDDRREAEQDQRGDRSTGPHPAIIVSPGMSARLSWLCAVVMLAACGGGAPTTPGGGDTINGSERLGWEQPAADAGELAS